MVPKDWKVGSLSDLADTVMGFAFKSTDFTELGIPLLRMGNLYQNTLNLERSPVFLPESFKNEYNRFVVKSGDLIMSMTGTMGKRDYGFVVEIPKDAPDALLNQRVMKLIPKNKTSMGYLLNLLRSELILSRLYSFPGGTKQANLSAKQVQDLPALIPPLAEQKKIAQILSTWDKTITITEQLIANSQQQKKALMQQLLTGKKRLLDKNGVRFSGEWKRVKLGSVADMNSGGTPKSNVEEYYGGDIPWVSISDMTSQGKWIAATEKNLTTLGLDNSSARIYPKNSVLYAMYASIGECSIAQVPLSSSQAILGIRPKAELDFEFLYFFLTSLKGKIKLQGQQGTQSNLNAGMVKDFLLHLPSMDEQQKIASVLSTADQEVIALQKKLSALKQEKKALMQQLLTGKRRVKVEEAA